ncbi:MAG: hypothetical protein ACRCXT_08870 [Paraclostridium sp.]
MMGASGGTSGGGAIGSGLSQIGSGINQMISGGRMIATAGFQLQTIKAMQSDLQNQPFQTTDPMNLDVVNDLVYLTTNKYTESAGDVIVEYQNGIKVIHNSPMLNERIRIAKYYHMVGYISNRLENITFDFLTQRQDFNY